MAQQINVWTFAKLVAVVAALLGLVAGLAYAIGGLFIDLQTIGLNKGTALAFLAIPLMPLYFAIPGAALAAVGGFLYNRVAPKIKWNISTNLKK